MKVDAEPRERHKVLKGSHGNELQIAGILHQMAERQHIPGINFCTGHMLASMLGVRYVAETPESTEIMSSSPDINGDPQQVQFARNLSYFAFEKPLVIFDMHEQIGQGSYFSVGRRSTVPAIAGARLLNKNTCLVQDLRFFRDIPNAVAIENSLMGADPRSIAEEMYQGFKDIASVRLRDVPFEDAISGVKFYQKFDIFSSDQHGKIASYLEALEEIVPTVAPFEPFDLPDELKEQLLLPFEAEIGIDTWGHLCMAMENPELGYTKTGIPRKEVFGSIVVRLDQPTEKDGNVVFQREKRSLSRKSKGLLRLAI